MINRILITVMLLLAVSTQTYAEKVGGIEIGSRGIKCTGFNINGSDISKIDSSYNNIGVMSLKSGAITPENITNAVNAVSACKENFDKSGYAKTFIAISSGVNIANNTQDLSRRIFEKTNMQAAILTTEEEGFYTIVSSVGPAKIASVTVIDVGSGNSRVAYLQDKKPSSIRIVPVHIGTITTKDKALALSDNKVKYSENVKTVVKDGTKDMSNDISRSPGVKNPYRQVYIVGGSAWAISSLINPNQIGKSTIKYTMSDLEKFIININKTQTITFPKTLTSDASKRTMSSIADTISDKDIIAGGNLLYSILKEVGVNGNRELVFPSESGWISGFTIWQYMK